MNAEAAPRPSSDERVMAALAHFFGLIAALIVWALQKDKSRFVRFQALQALAFDGLVIVFNMVLMACLFGAMVLGGAGAAVVAARNASSPDSIFPVMLVPMLLWPAIILCIMPLSLVTMAVRIIAAVSAAGGHNFRYPWIASRVEAFLAE